MKTFLFIVVIGAGIGVGAIAGNGSQSLWVADPEVAAGEWRIEIQTPPCDDPAHNLESKP